MKTVTTRIIAILMTLVTLMGILPCAALADYTGPYSCSKKVTLCFNTSVNIGDCKLKIEQNQELAVWKTKDGKKSIVSGSGCKLTITVVKNRDGSKTTYTMKATDISRTLRFNWFTRYIVTVTATMPDTHTFNGETYYFDHWQTARPAWHIASQKGIDWNYSCASGN